MVALVVVTSVVVPTIENADVQVYLDAYFVGGMLSYSIELVDAVESETYYAVLLEGGTIVQQETIVDSQLSGSLTGLDGSKDHSVEVRTGLPPLLVLASQTIPGEPVWAELEYCNATYDSIEFSVQLHGTDEGAYVTLSDPETGSTIYSSSLTDGHCSDTVSGLAEAHTYILSVESSSTAYMRQDISTLSPVITLDGLSASKNTVSFSVTVEGIHSELTAELIDPETSAAVYSTVLTEGTNSGTVSELKYNHTYALSVASSEASFINQSITTESLPIEVELKDLSVSENNVSYVVDVAANGQTVTAYLYGSSGEAVYSMDLTDGTNTGTISGLEFGKEYKFEVSHELQTFVSQTVVIEPKEITVELISLEVEGNTIIYEIQVTGDSEIVTLYLYDISEEESLVASLELSEGINSDTFTDLELGKGYRFTASSESETYVDETVEIGEYPTDPIIVNSIKAYYCKIAYDVSVSNTANLPYLRIVDEEGNVVYDTELEVGDNKYTVTEGISYGYYGGEKYLVEIESTEYHYDEWFEIPDLYEYSIEAKMNHVDFTVTINDDILSDKTIFLIDDEYYPEEINRYNAVYWLESPADNITEASITTGLEYYHTYWLGVLQDGHLYKPTSVTLGPANLELTPYTRYIVCDVTLGDEIDPTTSNVIIQIYDLTGQFISEERIESKISTHYFNNLDPDTDYAVIVLCGADEFASKNVTTAVNPVASLSASSEGSTVNYSITSTSSIEGLVVYLIPTVAGSTQEMTITEAMLDDGVYKGSFEVLNIGTFNVVINDSESYENPSLNSYTSKQVNVSYGTITGYSLELNADGKIHYGISFDSTVSVDYYLLKDGKQDYKDSESGIVEITGEYSQWVIGSTYTLGVMIGSNDGVNLTTLTIDADDLIQSPSFIFRDDQLSYDLSFKSTITGTIQLIDEDDNVIESVEVSGNSKDGTFNNWERGKTYILRFVISDVPIDIKTVAIPNPVNSLTASTTGNKINYEVSFTDEASWLKVYLIKYVGESLSVVTSTDIISEGSFDGLDIGSYKLVINTYYSSYNPTVHPFAISEMIIVSPVASHSLSIDGDGSIQYIVNFSSIQTGELKLMRGNEVLKSTEFIDVSSTSASYGDWIAGYTYTLRVVISEHTLDIDSLSIPIPDPLISNLTFNFENNVLAYSLNLFTKIGGKAILKNSAGTSIEEDEFAGNSTEGTFDKWTLGERYYMWLEYNGTATCVSEELFANPITSVTTITSLKTVVFTIQNNSLDMDNVRVSLIGEKTGFVDIPHIAAGAGYLGSICAEDFGSYKLVINDKNTDNPQTNAYFSKDISMVGGGLITDVELTPGTGTIAYTIKSSSMPVELSIGVWLNGIEKEHQNRTIESDNTYSNSFTVQSTGKYKFIINASDPGDQSDTQHLEFVVIVQKVVVNETYDMGEK